MSAPSRFATRMSRATAIFAALALACGIIGYTRVPLTPADGLEAQDGIGYVLDLVYLALATFRLGIKQTYGDPFLAIGRWFGVLFVFSAAIRIMLPHVVAAYARWRIRMLHGHAVIVGLGAKGSAFAADLARRTALAVMDVETVERAQLAIPPGSHPVYVLSGDGASSASLEYLNLPAAARVLITTGSDVTNHKIVCQVVEVTRRRNAGEDPLELIVHFADPRLGQTLLTGLSPQPGIRIRPFSLPIQTARTLVARHPWMLGCDRLLGTRRHWIFVGWDAYAEALLLLAIRLGAGSPGRMPRFSVFVDTPPTLERQLHDRYPAASQLLESVAIFTTTSTGVASDEDLRSLTASHEHSSAYIFEPDDASAFSAAHRLRAALDRIGSEAVPIFVRMDAPRNFIGGLHDLAQVRRLASVIEPFGSLADTCTDQALQDWHERLAMEVHASYREDRMTSASTKPLVASAAEWAALPEDLRESNRRAVDHLPVKLAALGFIVRKELPLPFGAVPLDTDAAYRIARLEHESWMAEKRLDGWTAAGVRDDRRRWHDRLVPFDALAADTGLMLDPFRRILALAKTPRDPWLASWLSAGRAQGGGAFRERLLGLRAAPEDCADDAAADAAFGTLLEQLDAARRLGADGDEFWTVAVAASHPCDLAFARACDRALERCMPARKKPARHRLVVVSGTHPGRPRPSELDPDAFLRSGGPAAVLECWIELAEGTDPLAHLAGACDDWVCSSDAAARAVLAARESAQRAPALMAPLLPVTAPAPIAVGGLYCLNIATRGSGRC